MLRSSFRADLNVFLLRACFTGFLGVCMVVRRSAPPREMLRHTRESAGRNLVPQFSAISSKIFRAQRDDANP